MAYTLGNKCAKKFCKRTILVQLIVEDVVTCLFWNTSVERGMKKSRFSADISLFLKTIQYIDIVTMEFYATIEWCHFVKVTTFFKVK